MAGYEELPVFGQVYRLNLHVIEITGKFPREHKYTLGEALRRDCLHLLGRIYRINKASVLRPFAAIGERTRLVSPSSYQQPVLLPGLG